jgi:hypothetical protein
MRNNFEKDLARGHEIEKYILEKIKKKYPCAVLIEGSHKYYDLFIPETDKKIEIKGDYKSKETGNIIIELMMYGKTSALLSTKADYWVIYTGDEIFWIEPKKIIECIILNNIRSKTLTGDGDIEPKTACLIPVDTFKKYVSKIEKIDER